MRVDHSAQLCIIRFFSKKNPRARFWPGTISHEDCEDCEDCHIFFDYLLVELEVSTYKSIILCKISRLTIFYIPTTPEFSLNKEIIDNPHDNPHNPHNPHGRSCLGQNERVSFFSKKN